MAHMAAKLSASQFLGVGGCTEESKQGKRGSAGEPHRLREQ